MQIVNITVVEFFRLSTIMVSDRYRFILYSVIAGISCDLLVKSFFWLSKKFHRSLSANNYHSTFKAIFFPDSQASCRNHFTLRHGCTSLRCRFSHDPENAYAQLLQCVQSARRSIDLCVYVITCTELVDVVVGLYKMGVSVRVISDNEQVDATGSQITRFRMEGIQVRHDSSSYYMHHKFVVIDDHLLVNGSFNWTRQAITGNNENLIITDQVDLVSAFRGEFDKLWQAFDPSLVL